MLIENYLNQIKIKLLASPVITTVTIVKERTTPEQGYLRVSLTLINGDFVELAEFFAIEDQTCITKTYRYQWMDSTKQELRRRWDNVEHFPNLPNFPHHVHIEAETNVHPSKSQNMLEIIDQIEGELGNVN